MTPLVTAQKELSDAYLLARKSIRIWPVKGSTNKELWGGAGDFLHSELGIPTDVFFFKEGQLNNKCTDKQDPRQIRYKEPPELRCLPRLCI